MSYASEKAMQSETSSMKSTSTSSSLRSLFKKDKAPKDRSATNKDKEAADKAIHREAMYTYMSTR